MDGPKVFCFPMPILENDLIKLAIFEPSLHAKGFVSQTTHTELFNYLPFGPFNDEKGFYSWFEATMGHSGMLYAVFDKLSPSVEMAGIIGLLNTFPEHASTEVGFVITFPKYQRTHVTTNAIGLLVTYLLDPPPSGLGLRRVQWQAHAENKASVRAAERLGFVFEGIQRWQRALPPGKMGNGVDVSHLPPILGKNLGAGRHSAVLSICWDEWEDKKQALQQAMVKR